MNTNLINLTFFLLACLVSFCVHRFQDNEKLSRAVFIATVPLTLASLIIDFLFPRAKRWSVNT